ncbi:MAG: AbrB/MazE/SpoVT family DNA-binding domain-containing protein [Sphingomonadales bacterium]
MTKSSGKAVSRAKVGPRGNASAVTLSKDILSASRIRPGDEVHIVSDESGIHITKVDDTYAQAMEAGEDCFTRYPRTMRDLAS